MKNRLSFTQGWSLFLDRDGVINQRLKDDYVKNSGEFEFIPGVENALAILAQFFTPMVVVTNQQGIGKGLMTSEQLDEIHQKMIDDVKKKGGRIDAVFFSPDLKNSGSFTRKPAIGLGLKARKQFPAINFKHCIMVGDSYSDILFGKRLGMITVLLGTDKSVVLKSSEILDFTFPDLISFANYVKENIQATV